MHVSANTNVPEMMRHQWAKKAEEKERRLCEATKDLKVSINNFLYQQLPDTATIKDMERIALEVFKLVAEEWEKHV